METSTKYLLVGGGLASVWAAQNIRERDKEGRIVIATDENRPPYDKPPLSKNYLANDEIAEDDAYSKFDNFYPDNNIELLFDHKVTKIDRAGRSVTTENGDTIRYEKMLLATGACPRQLDVPGSDLRNIYTLRKLDDSLAIRRALEGSKRAVLVGAGYLNMEVASGCVSRGIKVTVVEPQDRPWSRLSSERLGRFLGGAFGAKGVEFLFGDEVTEFLGGGSVSDVVTKNGVNIPTDMVVVSIGVTLNTEIARDAGLEIGDRGGVMVDEYFQTSDPNVWAVGDIACFKDIALGKQWHAEHHLNAKWQGRAVGAIMAGEHKPYDQVPYFFSDFLDLHMVLRGDPAVGTKDAHTTVFGDFNHGEFVELYPDDAGTLRLGIAISHEEKKLDPISDKLEELVRAKAKMADLSAGTFGL